MTIALIGTAASSAAGFQSTKSLALNTSGQSNVGIAVLAFTAYPGGDVCSGVNYNGNPLTAATDFTFGYPTHARLFYGVLASGVSANLDGTWGSADSQPLLMAVAYSGVGSISNPTSASGTIVGASIPITTTAGDLAVALSIYDYLGAGEHAAPGTSVTQRLDDNAAGQWSAFIMDKIASGSSTTVDWTISSGGGKWGAVGLAMTPAGAGGGGGGSNLGLRIAQGAFW